MPISNTMPTTDSVANPFTSIGNGIISFFIGFCAFFVFKLFLMIPANIIVFQTISETNPEGIRGIAGLFLILAIYLAVKYTQKLNRNGTRKSRNIKRALTVIAGVISMIITTIAISPVI